jgi:glycerol-3-phosphate acyltransferase PlsX
MTAIAVDAMGGDNAPHAEVAGALAAVRDSDVQVLLVGDKERLVAELKSLGAEESDQLRIVHASEAVLMTDHPGKVFRQKTDSSMRVATDLVLSKEAAAMVSAGNSGAVLSHCLFVLKRMASVERPGIVQVFPTPTSTVTICDLGANVTVSPVMLAQFGILGSLYDRVLNGRQRPRVAVLSNGTEESKGTDLTRAAFGLLKRAAAHPDAVFEFVGYVEGSRIFTGDVDVVATDGFTGNIVLKTAEGVSDVVMRMVKNALMSSPRSKLGALLAKPALQELKRSIHYSEYGGAMLLGVNGTAIICHGHSDARAIRNAILITRRFVDQDLQSSLKQAIERHEELWSAAKAKEEEAIA